MEQWWFQFLTDEVFFKGHLDYLQEILVDSIQPFNKDFMSVKSKSSARMQGQQSSLLIVTAIRKTLAQRTAWHYLTELGLEVLVETHQSKLN